MSASTCSTGVCVCVFIEGRGGGLNYPKFAFPFIQNVFAPHLLGVSFFRAHPLPLSYTAVACMLIKRNVTPPPHPALHAYPTPIRQVVE